MTKVIALFITVFVSLTAYAQNDTAITYSETVIVDSANADELFSCAKKWFAHYYRNAADSFHLSVGENDELIGNTFILYRTRSFFKRSETASGKIRYTISIRVRDGMYEYTITNFEHMGSASSIDPPANFGLLTSAGKSPEDLDKSWNLDEWYDNIWKELKSTVAAEAKTIILSLKEAMKAASRR